MVAGQMGGTARMPVDLSDDRILAAIPMSAPAARDVSAYRTVDIPLFHMTGTEDYSTVTDTTPEQRRIPFDSIEGVDQYLITFTGGDHMIFSGRPRLGPGGERDEEFRRVIRAATLAFWDAYLLGDEEALAWLKSGGLADFLGDTGVLEQKEAG